MFQDYGVDKVHWLHDAPGDIAQKNILYLARCTPKNAHLIASKSLSFSVCCAQYLNPQLPVEPQSKPHWSNTTQYG